MPQLRKSAQPPTHHILLRLGRVTSILNRSVDCFRSESQPSFDASDHETLGRGSPTACGVGNHHQTYTPGSRQQPEAEELLQSLGIRRKHLSAQFLNRAQRARQQAVRGTCPRSIARIWYSTYAIPVPGSYHYLIPLGRFCTRSVQSNYVVAS